jgi:hypothetical protein
VGMRMAEEAQRRQGTPQGLYESFLIGQLEALKERKQLKPVQMQHMHKVVQVQAYLHQVLLALPLQHLGPLVYRHCPWRPTFFSWSKPSTVEASKRCKASPRASTSSASCGSPFN